MPGLGIQDWWQSAQAVAASYSVGSWLFLRALGVIYALAFLSLAVQIKGLTGRAGIPATGARDIRPPRLFRSANSLLVQQQRQLPKTIVLGRHTAGNPCGIRDRAAARSDTRMVVLPVAVQRRPMVSRLPMGQPA